MRSFVLGVSDRDFTVSARPAPVWTVQRDDLYPPQSGYQVSVIRLGILRLPFDSYSGEWVVWYAGWQPNGFFGAKFNIRETKRYLVDPEDLQEANDPAVPTNG